MNYEETLQYLYAQLPVFHQIGAKAYKPGLEKSLDLMSRLGNPHNSYKVIHVAGTNGKGSVSNMLAAILEESGYKVGLYTSPHLIDFGERIRVNGEQIEQEYVVNFVHDNKVLFEELQPSFFEATMAMAFDYFAVKKVDIAVVEVGLGGRLDSTNIVNPVVSVITNIGLDHTMFLGSTLEEVAYEKAGIIKQGIPAIVGVDGKNLQEVFCQKASEVSAPISFVNPESVRFISLDSQKLVVDTDIYGEIVCGLTGLYQLKNIATVIDAVQVLSRSGFQVPKLAVLSGLRNVVAITGLRGRWETVSYSPQIILDTGHNPDAIGLIVKQLSAVHYKKLHIVFGMADDKDSKKIVSLLPRDACYYFTAADSPRSKMAEDLKDEGERVGLIGEVFHSIEAALRVAKEKAGSEDVIFVGGSNFVVGEALAFLEQN